MIIFHFKTETKKLEEQNLPRFSQRNIDRNKGEGKKTVSITTQDRRDILSLSSALARQVRVVVVGVVIIVIVVLKGMVACKVYQMRERERVMVRFQKKHCVLDSCAAVPKLHAAKIYPLVFLTGAKSWRQLMYELYQCDPKHFYEIVLVLQGDETRRSSRIRSPRTFR